MALRGHVFSKQLFSSECFALFIDIFLGKNSGIVEGCELLSTANNITLEKGFFCIKGRFLEEEEHSIFEVEPVEQDPLFCKLVCEIDLSQQNTTSELKQAYYRIIQSVNDYPTLQQEDITQKGSIYQFEFAQFKITTNGIEDFQDKRTFLDFESFYSEIRRNAQAVFDDITAKKNDFFEMLNVTTKAEADKLIKDLQEYCNSVKQALDGDVAVNLLNQINTKADIPRSRTITLIVANWIQVDDHYEYDIADADITANHFAFGSMDRANQAKMKDADIVSYNGGVKITTSTLPEADITMDLTTQLTQGGDANAGQN